MPAIMNAGTFLFRSLTTIYEIAIIVSGSDRMAKNDWDVLFGKEVLANQSKPATDLAIGINLEHAVAQIIITAKANEEELIKIR